MTYRLVTAIIFLFCGTMTVLLVRSVLFPEGTGLAAVSTHKAFDYFAARSEGEGSVLDIWERDSIIGSCRITPRSGDAKALNNDAKALTKIDKIGVDVDIRVRLQQEVLNSRQVVVGGAVVLHADGMIDDLRLRFSLPGSRPPIELELRQPPGQEWPSMELRQGTTTLMAIGRADAVTSKKPARYSSRMPVIGLSSSSGRTLSGIECTPYTTGVR